jgi:hypothetical protein
MPVTEAARASLDDLLVPLGFTPGQGGASWEGDAEQVIFCIGLTDFVERFPDLPPPGTPEGAWTGGECLDLAVTGTADGIDGVDLEGLPLDALLRDAGHPELADRCGEWPGAGLAADLAPVRDAMAALLHLP